MRLGLLLGVLGVMACDDGVGNEDELQSSDVRIDGASAADAIASEDVRMCVNEAGDAFVVWSDDREGNSSIWFQASHDGGDSWVSQAIQINHGDGNATSPDIACTGNTVYVVWEDTRDGELDNKNIYFNRSDSGGFQWGEEDLRLDADEKGKFQSIGPRIAASGDKVHIVWSDALKGAYDIYAATSTDRGAGFQAAVRVNSDAAGSAFSAFPQVAMDGQGRVFVAWEDARNQLNDIYFSLSTDSGASFGDDVRLDGGDDMGTSDSFAPRMAASGGHVYVVWHDERNGSNRDILMNWSSDSGATWQSDAAQVDSDGAGTSDSMFPAIAMVGNKAHVAWQDSRMGGYDIFYRSVTDGTMGEESASGLDAGERAGASNSINARIAVDQDNVAVVWEDRRSDGYNYENPSDPNPSGFNDLYYNYSGDGGETWLTDDLRIDSWPQGQKYAVNVTAALHDDLLLTVWEDGRHGSRDIMFTLLTLGDKGEVITPQ
ncbi:MAG: hypothetical protein ACI9MC_001982 [Kiritimatiellia bacterium]|jgi:hypothetical protein